MQRTPSGGRERTWGSPRIGSMAMRISEDGRAAMTRLVGTWRTEGTIVDGVSPGHAGAGYDIYEWFPGDAHLVHRVDVAIFGKRQESLELLTPRGDGSGVVDQVSFAADGTVEKSLGRFSADRYVIDAGGARATLSFDGERSMRATWEIQHPDQTWHDWMHVRFTRIGDPRIEIRSKDAHAD